MSRETFLVEAAWLQKHPSPSSQSWDFHWHARDPSRAAKLAKGALAEQLSHPYSHVSLGPDAVVWTRSFAATSSGEKRRYTGAALVVARRQHRSVEDWWRRLPAIIASMPAVTVAPCSSGSEIEPREIVIEAPSSHTVGADKNLARAAARAVLFGGDIELADPLEPRLPSALGAIMTWLPRQRWSLSMAFGTQVNSVDPEGRKNLIHYLGRVALGGGNEDQRRRAWNAACELADGTGNELEAEFAMLTRTARAWDEKAALAEFLVSSGTLRAVELEDAARRAPAGLVSDTVPDAGWLWSRTLNYWGRGFLGEAPDLPGRLAITLARRIVADRLFTLDNPQQIDPDRYLHRLRGEALLPARRLGVMLEQLGRIVPSLQPL